MNNQLIINKLTSAKQGQIGENLFEEYLNLKKLNILSPIKMRLINVETI